MLLDNPPPAIPKEGALLIALLLLDDLIRLCSTFYAYS
jgi:hypothetical protein